MMNVKCFTVTLPILLLSLPLYAQSLPDLVVDSATETVYLSGVKWFRNVSVISGATLAYGASETEDRLAITCSSLFVEPLGTIAACVPFWYEGPGEAHVHLANEFGETAGNGGGTYGGRGFNISNESKAPYGSPSGFEIQPGSNGTKGEAYLFRFGGQTTLRYGLSGAEGGGVISITANNITINGNITADGQTGFGNPCSSQAPGYSGSGGGILIAAKNLNISSTARITANGGEYYFQDTTRPEDCPSDFPRRMQWDVVGKRDGGGGRIKIFYEQGTISPDAVIEAKGYEDGTVHIQQVRSIDQLLNPGDLNGDGVTNHEDLFILQQSWQQELTPIPSPEETPTPTQ